MADGTTQPIQDVKIGDLVTATDPTNGETTSERVSDVIEGTGVKYLARIGTDRNKDDLTEWVTATTGHPVWVYGSGWAPVGQLKTGDGLVNVAGEPVTVVATETAPSITTVYNLTVENVHTYYVEFDDQAVLVHNCASPRFNDNQSAVIKAAKAAEKFGSMTPKSAKSLYRQAVQYRVRNSHGIETHPNRGGFWANRAHIKINGTHIRVKR